MMSLLILYALIFAGTSLCGGYLTAEYAGWRQLRAKEAKKQSSRHR